MSASISPAPLSSGATTPSSSEEQHYQQEEPNRCQWCHNNGDMMTMKQLQTHVLDNHWLSTPPPSTVSLVTDEPLSPLPFGWYHFSFLPRPKPHQIVIVRRAYH
jgi:hypothetical protein